MKTIKFAFCFGLSLIAYKALSPQDLKVLYQLTVKEINRCVPFFKNIMINFNDLITSTNSFNDLDNAQQINERIHTLNENIKKINEHDLLQLQFHKKK